MERLSGQYDSRNNISRDWHMYIFLRFRPKKFPPKKFPAIKFQKIDNIGQNVSSQNYLNKDNEHYNFSYYIINSVVGSKADIKNTFFLLHKLYN